MSVPQAVAFPAILLLGIAGAFVTADAASDGDVDDGWRRTVNGWERIEQFRQPDEAASDYHFTHLAPGRTFDVHPLALAVGQLSVVLVAYCLCPASCKGGASSLVGAQRVPVNGTLRAA